MGDRRGSAGPCRLAGPHLCVGHTVSAASALPQQPMELLVRLSSSTAFSALATRGGAAQQCPAMAPSIPIVRVQIVLIWIQGRGRRPHHPDRDAIVIEEFAPVEPSAASHPFADADDCRSLDERCRMRSADD